MRENGPLERFLSTQRLDAHNVRVGVELHLLLLGGGLAGVGSVEDVVEFFEL